jgi:hypothetical protein
LNFYTSLINLIFDLSFFFSDMCHSRLHDSLIILNLFFYQFSLSLELIQQFLLLIRGIIRSSSTWLYRHRWFVIFILFPHKLLDLIETTWWLSTGILRNKRRFMLPLLSTNSHLRYSRVVIGLLAAILWWGSYWWLPNWCLTICCLW